MTDHRGAPPAGSEAGAPLVPGGDGRAPPDGSDGAAPESAPAAGRAEGRATGQLFLLDDVSFVVEGRRVLDHITLAVADRGITVIVGPSGGGKTTLLRLLNRLEVPTEGEVRFRGTPLDALDPLILRRRVGMVFQRPAPFPGLVRHNLLVADPAASEAHLSAALDAAGLDDSFLDRAADDLSGGETQRMCLARTLVTDPEVLLMDEPTSALDRASGRRLEATARRLADEGRPVLWVTHDLDQADRLADDRILVIDGHVASPEERDRYLASAALHPEGESPDDG